jgi:hypothetical protein
MRFVSGGPDVKKLCLPLTFAAGFWVLTSLGQAGTSGPSTGGGEVPRWGVIAADERGSFGYAIGYSLNDKDRAWRDAVVGCGQANCKTVLEAQTFCVALADARGPHGEYWYWVAHGQRSWNNGAMDAGRQAIQWCEAVPQARAAGCKLQIYSCQ